MGLDPNADADIAFENGDFNAPAGWDIRTWWSIAGGKAILNRLTAVENSLRQYNMDIQQGNVYTIEFEILVANFIDEPAKGITLFLGGVTSGVYNTVGVHTWEVLVDSNNTTFTFSSNSIDIGDYAEIAYVGVQPEGDFLMDVLEIGIPYRPRKEVWNMGGGRMNQILASRNGNTNVLIAYDL
jgi:hypothetical protein